MTSQPLILIVDDEPQIQRFLRHALTASGYRTEVASTGHEALRAVDSLAPDLMVLDLGLPDLDGKTVIERLRQVSDLPVIVLSAHDHEMEKILALDLGANDFVAKPFAIGELLARLRVSLRSRASQARAPDPVLDSGGVRINRDSRAVTVENRPLRLTPKEFDLLLALASHPGRVLTHRQLLLQVWGPAHGDDLPYLRVFIGQLRQKLGPAADCIRTEPGVGYRWLSDAEIGGAADRRRGT